MLDLLIRNGTILDGTGKKGFRGDVGISGDRIEEVGHLQEAKARQALDAAGLAVSPGFVDVHSHHDLYILDRDPAFGFASFVRQGVTTSVVGNCGWTLAPCLPGTENLVLELIRSMDVPIEKLSWHTMDEYLRCLEQQELMCNVAHLVGHGTIRLSVMGDQNRFCTADELEQMKRLVREALEAGCVGLSTGLMYYPGMFAHTDELVELARVAAEFGRPYATHLRGYCTTLPDSTQEAVTISSKSGASLQISHLHAVPFFGRLASLVHPAVDLLEAINARVALPALPNPALDKGLQAIEEALDQGLDIGMDAVPYTLGNTTVTVLFPPWANRGGKKRLLERIRDPESRRRIEHDIRTVVPKWPHWEEGSWSDPYIKALGWKPIRVLSLKSEGNRWAEGKTFEEIGRAWGVDPFSALCRLTLEEEGEISFTFGYPARPWLEKMFNKMLRHPMMSIGADSILPGHGIPPPSAYGCFPRVLGHYCRDLGFFSLEEAVRKMTSLPAGRYHLKDRAEIRRGAFADIVVFDPDRVDERFDAEGRPAFAEGIRHVFINGRHILSEGKLVGDLYPGRVLRQ
jgi:N-acyl-D-aspartate/D-glutamate deacylase